VVSPRLRGAAVALLCVVALAGCGAGHPGAAAQVGDVSISEDSLEQSTGGFCEVIDTINLAQQGTTPPVPLRSALLSALNVLVMGEAIDQVAANNHVQVSPAEVRQWVDGLPLDFSKVPQSRKAETQVMIERVGRNTLLTEKLGRLAYQRQNPGATSAPSDQVQQIGQQLVNDYMKRVGVQTNPRYGRVFDPEQIPGTGSLSIPVTQEGLDGEGVPDPSSNLPPSQRCA
jgi:hypothetical protein